MNIKYYLMSLCLALFMAIGVVNAAERINLNTATIAQLQTLPGIGHKSAAAIVDYRNSHGLFASVDALKNVKGIGKKRLDAIRDDVEVSHGSK